MKKSPFYYHIFDTLFGFGAVLFQENPFLIKRIWLPCKKRSTQRHTIQATTSGTARQTEEALAFCQQIQAYFEGTPIFPPLKHLDLRSLTPLQQLVLKTVCTIPFGSTQSYGQIAERVGRPRACRFIGMTMHRNPFPVAVPCHRVIRGDGSPGGFGGSVTLKRQMLALEKEHIQNVNRG